MSLDSFGGRKFLAMLIGIVAGAAVELVGHRGLSAELAGLIGVLVATFCGTNAMTTNKALDSLNSIPTAAPSVDNSQIVDALSSHVGTLNESNLQVKGALETVLQGQANLQKGMAAIIGGRVGQ